MYTPQEQKDAIKEAIDLTNDFPLATIDPGTEIPKDISAKSGHPEILYQVIADVSFKLYIIHHSKTDKDFYKLHDYCFILDMLKSLYYEEYNKNISAVVCQIKYAYPLIGDDPVLRDFVIALSNILQNRSFHVGIFFVYAMKITNYLAGIPLAAHKLINNTKMHSARSIQSRSSWKYIEPIFKECAAQIGPNFTPREIGKLFNQFFYEKKAANWKHC